MTRRSIEQKESLDTMVQIYGDGKVEEGRVKKLIEAYNAKIKQAMKDGKLTEFAGTDYQASVTETPREDFNELQAIEILRKELPPEVFSELVKTREYIDDEALEKAIYAKTIDAAILAPCTTPKDPTVTLRVTKIKKKK